LILIIGTGKSYLIETICQHIKYTYANDATKDGWLVAVLAPTGLAAYNINGQTIHRFFKLPVFHVNSEKHWPLNNNNLKLIRDLLPNLRVCIIGESKFY